MPATDQELLLIRIEAQLRQFEKAMDQARGKANRTANGIAARFNKLNRELANIPFARSILGPLAALVSAREIGQAVDAFTRIQNSLRVAGVDGEQMAAVFDRLFDAAQKNAAPVESLVELYSRASLVQRELGVSSEELLRFTEGVAAALRVSGKSAAESSGALLQLSQALGSGVVRAEEFNSILEGALPIAQAAARGLEEAGGSVAKLRTLIIDGKVSSEAFFRAFEAGQGTLEALAAVTEVTLSGAFTRLQNSIIAAVGRFNDTFGVSRELSGQFDILARQIEGLIGSFLSLAQPIEDIDSKFRSLINSVNGVAEAVGRFTGLGNVGTALGITSEEELRIQRAAETADAMRTDLELASKLREKAKGVGDLIAGPAEVQPVSLRDFASPTSTRSGSGRGGARSPADTFARDIESIRARTAALETDTLAVGKSVLEAERLRAVTDLLNEAKRAGLTITPELTASIEAEADAYAQAADRLDATEQKYREVQEAQDFFAQTAFDSFSELIPIIETGNTALDRMLNTLIEAVAQSLLLGNGPLAGLFGTSTRSGGVGGLLGGLFGGFRAQGGPVSAGRPYVVGERGPEIFVPRQAGMISAGVGGMQEVNVKVGIDPSPLFVTTVRQTQLEAINENNRALAAKQTRYG